MVRHGNLSFGFNLSDEDWKDIKQEWASLVDFDPYEPEWRYR